ncbi:hypothetical protein HPB49_021938 [Dermacentor silvarum]|uniref:Uncharacterized protein n=1 Tax=Dermacentor silvarum TaxID=543639 RepID=A0ACB8CZS3_DERSI|nr:hypothetical protein HPB49_021938 [Dermacentor silvarum]
MHAILLSLKCQDTEDEVKSLRYLAGQLLQVLGDNQVSSLVDEWLMLKCDDIGAAPSLEKRIDDYWAKIFCLKSSMGEPKYPLPAMLFKALLSLLHGNADCEKGFSDNKHLLEGRSSLSLASIKGMRHIKSYLQRYGVHVTKVPLSLELVRSLKQARNKYILKMDAEESSSKRKQPTNEGEASCQDKRAEEKKMLKKQVVASREFLTSAEELISTGMKHKDMAKVQSGHVLLTKGNSSLELALAKLLEVEKQIMCKKVKH